MKANKNVKNLRIIIFAGLILFLLTGSILTVFYIIERSGSALTRQQDNFTRIMREFDEAYNGLFFTQSEFEHLNGQLDRMEKLSVTVESWMSILKRRRSLANIYSTSAVNYKKTIDKALAAFPQSQPIMAIAAEYFLKHSDLKNNEQLKNFLPLFTDAAYNSLLLSLHVLLGDFENPSNALAIAGDFYNTDFESININLALLKILRKDYKGASGDIQLLLNDDNNPADFVLRFAAEYNYDFGNLLRSAEIFSYLDDERSMIRQADALYLAGFPDIAGTLWEILAGTLNETSLYNLAVTSNDEAKSFSYLEKLINIETEKKALKFGIIRFSRMLTHLQAMALLEKNKIINEKISPFIDLEICKRQTLIVNPAHQAANAWLLLDRHENNEELYKWVFWNLFFHNNYAEAMILLDRVEKLKLNWNWAPFYNAVFSMQQGKIETAEKILREIPNEFSAWYVNANLGLIMEAERSPSRALEEYQKAVSKIDLNLNNKKASEIQVRIAKCYSALKRPIDTINSLNRALELDPSNLSARLELDRF